MKSYISAKVSFYISVLLLVFILLFFVVASLVSSNGYTQRVNALKNEEIQDVFQNATKNDFTIIIDAGHGGEDPGAVVGNISEKSINLDVAKKLAEFASLSGFNVVLTRSDDVLLYENGQENRKKFYDLYNRLAFTQKHTDSVFISIHQNKFPLEECKGMQVFYGRQSKDSEKLADCIRNSGLVLQPDNHRVIKEGKSIYLMENIQTPCVLIECGFLSNPIDANNLTNSEYTDKLAFALFCGIAAYLEGEEVEN